MSAFSLMTGEPSARRAGMTSVTVGLPAVMVPVLSRTTARTPCSVSSASALLNKMLISAPRPVPTMIATGVARPRDGRGEAQGARTADDHDGDGRGEGFVHVAARGDEPHDEGDGGDGEHDGNEHAGDLVGQACDGGLGGVGVLDQADDTREVGVGAHACGAEGKGAGAVDGGGAHGIADALLHRHGLAGQRALVHGRGALQYHAVDGDRLGRCG